MYSLINYVIQFRFQTMCPFQKKEKHSAAFVTSDDEQEVAQSGQPDTEDGTKPDRDVADAIPAKKCSSSSSGSSSSLSSPPPSPKFNKFKGAKKWYNFTI